MKILPIVPSVIKIKKRDKTILMKKIKLITALFLASILLFSCSSDDDSSSDDGTPGDTVVLVKSETVDANNKVNYIFNANNLLTSWTGIYPGYEYENTYVYDSNNRITESHFQETGLVNYLDDTFYTYNANGDLTNYDDVDLAYSGNVITASGTIEGNSNVTILIETNTDGLVTKLTEFENYTLYSYDANGNMVEAKYYNNNDVLLITYSLDYDQKVNPFYGQLQSVYIERFLEYFYPFEGIYISGYEGYSFPYLKNNITGISEDATNYLNITYNYNVEDQPTNVSQEWDDGDINTFTIAYYE